MKRATIFILGLGLIFATTVARAQEASAAQFFLQKMEAKYAAIKSYSDTTSVHYRNPDGTEGASAECKIWFDRPGLFRIDGESRRAPNAPPKREVIWADGDKIRSWSSDRAVALLNSIKLAGSKMFGTYAYHIPTLLEASYGGARRLHQIESPTLADDDTIEGVVCYHMRGNWSGDPYELWMGKKDFIVRRLTAIYSGYGMEEVHHDIVIDQPIAKKMFQFEPEKDVEPTPKK